MAWPRTATMVIVVRMSTDPATATAAHKPPPVTRQCPHGNDVIVTQRRIRDAQGLTERGKRGKSHGDDRRLLHAGWAQRLRRSVKAKRGKIIAKGFAGCRKHAARGTRSGKKIRAHADRLGTLSRKDVGDPWPAGRRHRHPRPLPILGSLLARLNDHRAAQIAADLADMMAPHERMTGGTAHEGRAGDANLIPAPSAARTCQSTFRLGSHRSPLSLSSRHIRKHCGANLRKPAPARIYGRFRRPVRGVQAGAGGLANGHQRQCGNDALSQQRREIEIVAIVKRPDRLPCRFPR